jgi:hypothetical protein
MVPAPVPRDEGLVLPPDCPADCAITAPAATATATATKVLLSVDCLVMLIVLLTWFPAGHCCAACP